MPVKYRKVSLPSEEMQEQLQGWKGRSCGWWSWGWGSGRLSTLTWSWSYHSPTGVCRTLPLGLILYLFSQPKGTGIPA